MPAQAVAEVAAVDTTLVVAAAVVVDSAVAAAAVDSAAAVAAEAHQVAASEGHRAVALEDRQAVTTGAIAAQWVIRHPSSMVHSNPVVEATVVTTVAVAATTMAATGLTTAATNTIMVSIIAAIEDRIPTTAARTSMTDITAIPIARAAGCIGRR